MSWVFVTVAVAVGYLAFVWAVAQLCGANTRTAAMRPAERLADRALKPRRQFVDGWNERQIAEGRASFYAETAPEHFRGGSPAGAEVIPLRRRGSDRGWAA